MNNDFFSNPDYKLPTTSNYMKFQDGDNTFRVLSSAIVGYEYFNRENKPVRSKEYFDTTPSDMKEGGSIKHFWAFVVWNYDESRIQILELTQKTIMAAVQALIKNPKWGNPKSFDITVSRSGNGLDTEYTIMPNPHSKLDIDVENEYAKKKINLDALYEGADPFQG